MATQPESLENSNPSERQNTSNAANTILLFDGLCNLCNGSVQWALLHDKQGVFHFAPLQSELGRRLLIRHGMDPDQINTVVLVDHDAIWLRSDVPLEVFRRVGGAWKLLYAFKIVPRRLRDWIYNWIAVNRYRWWGKRESCMLPRPEWKHRFLDAQ